MMLVYISLQKWPGTKRIVKGVVVKIEFQS
jgi:hypothetical protein